MARGTFGERLKRERDLREVSAEELCKATRISPRFLDALENEQWDKLPGGVFGRGFVRTIARYLGLNEESLLAEYDAAHNSASETASAKAEERIPRPPNWVPAIALIAVLLVLLGAFFVGRYAWHRYLQRRQRQESGQAAGLQAASAIPAVTESLDLTLATSAATHVRVMSDGVILLDSDLPAGITQHFSAREQFHITAQDASAVLLELNGQPMPLAGSPGASGTIVLGRRDLRQAPVANTQP
jgi:cytoskeletal protein RodZ